MKKVVITADSSSDIPPELAEKLGVDIVPLSIIIGEKCFSDGVDITPDDIYNYCDRDGLVPKTSAVTPASYFDFFQPHLKNGRAIVHICLSSAISSTYQNAVIAAASLEDVYPVDSLSLHTGIVLQILHACQLRDEGRDAQYIAAQLNSLRKKVRTTFIVSHLDYLARGGRCSSITALGANLLSIRPSIEMVEGKLRVSKKYRGKMTACYEQYARETLLSAKSLDRRWVIVSHSGVDDEVLSAVVAAVRDTADFDQLLVVRAGCTITSHCGPETLAVIYMEK